MFVFDLIQIGIWFAIGIGIWKMVKKSLKKLFQSVSTNNEGSTDNEIEVKKVTSEPTKPPTIGQRIDAWMTRFVELKSKLTNLRQIKQMWKVYWKRIIVAAAAAILLPAIVIGYIESPDRNPVTAQQPTIVGGADTGTNEEPTSKPTPSGTPDIEICSSATIYNWIGKLESGLVGPEEFKKEILDSCGCETKDWNCNTAMEKAEKAYGRRD